MSYVWPEKRLTEDFLTRWVPGFNRSGAPQEISHEQFLGRAIPTYTSSQQGYIQISTVGTTVAPTEPLATEPGTYGVARVTATAGVATGSGLRQEFNTLGIDAFGSGEVAWAARFKTNSVAPSAVEDVALFGGLCTQEAGVAEPNDGVYWYFDDSNSLWTLKAARGGARTVDASALGWTAAYHVLGFHINAAADVVTGYVDGVPVAEVAGANVQPNDGGQSAMLFDVLGIQTSDLVFDIDDIAWGRVL